jgi:septum formation protein
VLENAFRKASAVSAGRPRQIGRGRLASTDAPPIILGVDTVVALSQRVYGKPGDRQEAESTLRALAGKTHRVLSGLCVIEGDSVRSAAAVTEVRFQTISDALLSWYLDTEEWRERAGAYAIQGRGAALVAEIRGDYLNVVGLPVTVLQDLVPNLLGL